VASRRAQSIRLLADAGPTAAAIDRRKAFAVAVLSQLEGAYIRGKRAENAFHIRKEFHQAIFEVLKALDKLCQEIMVEPDAAVRSGLTPENFARFADPLKEFLHRAWRQFDRSKVRWEEQPFAGPRRGRKARTAIEVATMIAREYDRYFDRPAGRSKQSDKNNPFFRVCKAAEEILRADGHKDLSIGDYARNEGIDRACTALLKEVLGIGQDAMFMADNPRRLLLEKRKGIKALRKEPEVGG
jgi:hypothetical protein